MSFSDRAQTLIDRLAAGESPARLGPELATLREAWRDLSPDEQDWSREIAGELARWTRPQAREDVQAEARRALMGLEHVSEHAPTNVYTGAPEPDALLAHYGLASFRTGQREMVSAALAGRDGLVIMPTGGGKSLCYILPGLATERLTVVVSPLIALMSDQYRRLVEGGHPAVMLASGFAEDHNAAALSAIRSGQARLVFCSPERFASRGFVHALRSREIALFAVDEAHCLSQWGHDFRPDYLRLETVIAELGHPPVLACTATATPTVATEIAERLHLRDPLLVHGGFDRPNLSFDVLRFEGAGAVARKYATLLAALEDPDNRPAIIYAGTRAAVDSLTSDLRGVGFAAVAYHAGLEPDERAAAQFRFLEDDADVVVATNAFGMGVDKANVRSVIHYAVPTSIEGYYQEAGRAGRDGAPARALLLAMRADLGRLVRFNTDPTRETSPVARERGWTAYRAIEAFAWGSEQCRRTQILHHFGESDAGHASGRCCDVCDPVDWLPSESEIAARARARAPRKTQRADAPVLAPADNALFDALVAWRREAADGKPAYTVAHNATLQAVASARPGDPAALLAISGIGPTFVQRHADAVLEIVSAHS